MSQSLVTGVDIGHHSIKAVVLKLSGETYSLVSYKEIVVTDDIFADNYTLDYQKIVKKLKELKKSLPLFSRKVSIAVPDNAVISKILQIESDLDPVEQEFAIYQTFSHQSPLPIEELSLDFVKVTEKALTRSSSATYQVYATRREVVDSRVAATEKAGLEPVLLDVQMHSLVRIWQQVSKTQQRTNWMLLDIGYSQSSLCLDFSDKAPFCKDIPLGTRWFDQTRQHEQGISGIDTFTQEFIDRLARQIQLLTSVHGPQSLAGIWLSGGGATISGLTDAITERLNLPCEIFMPLSVFSHKLSKRRRALDEQQKFSTAAGLALRGIEWLEGEHAAYH
ncbi:type IV pilus assembly protein PilM [Vibrio sp. V27_P1S3P104]|uniref:type IV pilus assembly protein PilM n=1 Tax=unclassified Vibrio TaxID=2614977 RepID=UPI0013737F61|nr:MULTISPECIES: type IV pilus assembly protein PilM [unclassified Vibrio]NAW67897.1 type IV pilus assembly protein PilM [Vibrio sp. V28_P6S34P95]NAX05904.1 type IV pilus assembly protein PilM [Vibrio sp. V30_P3S12P165]NAX34711.1 type IV pilus assembly protein PilM [Vibrio sp. V29_P1S30P107]NAX36660.1 type IV pilus assembly protein PilM [Vibrio sp. V27_P1S3P104]NAX40575.1 type IV pilus assembly protein PilM [Vibrio sp. V26_P1S5P106]